LKALEDGKSLVISARRQGWKASEYLLKVEKDMMSVITSE